MKEIPTLKSNKIITEYELDIIYVYTLYVSVNIIYFTYNSEDICYEYIEMNLLFV